MELFILIGPSGILLLEKMMEDTKIVIKKYLKCIPYSIPKMFCP